MGWQQLTLDIDAADFARAEALLELAGAESISISDASDQPILEPDPGTTPLWPRLRLHAVFSDDLDLGGIGGLLDSIGAQATELKAIDAAELERAAQQLVRPLPIGPRLRVVPAEAFVPGDDAALGLHMGLAFGTGRHPSTRLCLEWLEAELGECVAALDYGCGTGVLALAALKLGASRALAVDTEPQALSATRRNAALNGLSDRIATVSPAALGPGRFDLILANILAQPLIDLAADFAARQPAGGRIVLSGILAAQLDAVTAHYAQWYEDVDARQRDGWCLVTALRRNGYDRKHDASHELP